ncbi:MAG: protein kinase domain-containing protein [Burkholderiales bacterium]
MKHILIVEAEPGLRRWLGMHLSTGGYEISSAADYPGALKMARGRAPDLALVSTDLEGSSAFGLVSTLRAEPATAHTRIVLLAPQKDVAAIARAKVVVPGNVLIKPLGRDDLLKAMMERLEAPSLSAPPTPPTAAPDSLRKEFDTTTGSGRSSVSGSTLSMESRGVSLLVVTLRNLVSMARALRARSLDALIQRFLVLARDAVVGEGGWIVRVDATGLVAVFENSPQDKRNHAFLAMDAALQVVVASRRAKQWAETALHEPFTPNLSVGCGVHSGEVIVARLPFDGRVTPSLAGVTVDIANRLNGRAKGLGWSVAASETAALLAGSRFEFARRATLTDTDHDLTLSILECVGLSPGSVMPEGLAFTAEVREAVLANTVIAKLAGDVDPTTADRTILVSSGRMEEIAPDLPDRRMDRRIGHGKFVTTFLAHHKPSGRKEAVKTIPLNPSQSEFVEKYLEAYRRIADLNRHEIVAIREIGRAPDAAYVAAELLPGGNLPDAIRQRVSIGVALSLLSQMARSLDALHYVGIAHGNLRADHFLFRDVQSVVLADFNVSSRIAAALSIEGGDRSSVPEPDHAAEVRADLRSLGMILLAMLSPDPAVMESALSDRIRALYEVSRLPTQLSSVQPLLDGLLGIEGVKAINNANDVYVEVSQLNDLWNRPAYSAS